MRYLLRGGPRDDESKTIYGGPPATIQHRAGDGTKTVYVPADETFTDDGETVHIFEPRGTED